MKRIGAVLVLAVAFASLVLAGVGPGREGPLALIRVAKGPSLSIALLNRIGVDVRQELSSCLIAVADGRELDLLRRNRVPLTVLARDAGGREIMVVETRNAGAFAALREAGHAVAVESGTALFWTDGPGAAEAVPAGLPRKALPAASVLRYIPLRPAAVTAPAFVAAPDPYIETIIAPVTSSDLASMVLTLQGFQTRYASTTNCEAAGDAIYGTFAALGLDDVHFESFTFSGGYASRNVVAQKTGRTYPADIYIICAHYDSTSPSRLTLAPGADDNASGTAAVLEAARALASHDFDFTVRVIAFSAEEWGLYGSKAYAAAARAAQQRILGVINLDMIAYADAMPEDLSLIVNGGSGWLADLFLAAGANYGPVAGAKTVDPSIIYSDHSPFWDHGYPALLAIEDYPLHNPYYHQTSDTLDKLNMDFFTASTRAAAGLLAELAQPVKPGYPATPVGLTGSPLSYRSVFNRMDALRLTWTAQTGAAGYNVYRSNESHSGYLRLNASPVAVPIYVDAPIGVESYYYAVTAVGPTGLESNRSLYYNFYNIPVASSLSTGLFDLRYLGPLVLRGIR
jgi:hypothetical protein